jgi:death-on-curing family protein
MTNLKHRDILYLDFGLMKEICHPLAMAFFDNETNPIPPFSLHDNSKLDSVLHNPSHTFDGAELYPTIIDKSCILLYSMAQGHCFPNGNKRIAVASFLVFLDINGYWFEADPEKLAEWVIKIASSRETVPPTTIDEILPKLKEWVGQHIFKM